MKWFFKWLWNAIFALFSPFIDFLYAVWDFLYSLMADVGQWIIDAFWWCVGVAVWWFWVCLDSVLSYGYDTFAFLLDLFPEFEIPTAYSSAVSTVMQVIGTIDCFVPVSVILACVVLYAGFLVAWCFYKFVKSWIPTVSGS